VASDEFEEAVSHLFFNSPFVTVVSSPSSVAAHPSPLLQPTTDDGRLLPIVILQSRTFAQQLNFLPNQ
jgi:hypothetical protein